MTDPTTPTPPPPEATPPGWYRDHYGQMRWWDGQQWGLAAPPSGNFGGLDGKSMAVLGHALTLVAGFIAPLVVYLVNGEKDPYVRHHAAEALNFQITMAIASLASVALMFVFVGFITMAAVAVIDFVLVIVAALAASRGEWYRYPINIRFVSGAVER